MALSRFQCGDHLPVTVPLLLLHVPDPNGVRLTARSKRISLVPLEEDILYQPPARRSARLRQPPALWGRSHRLLRAVGPDRRGTLHRGAAVIFPLLGRFCGAWITPGRARPRVRAKGSPCPHTLVGEGR